MQQVYSDEKIILELVECGVLSCTRHPNYHYQLLYQSK